MVKTCNHGDKVYKKLSNDKEDFTFVYEFLFKELDMPFSLSLLSDVDEYECGPK